MCVTLHGMAIIPHPQTVEMKTGTWRITPETVLIADGANRRNATYLQNLLCSPHRFFFAAGYVRLVTNQRNTPADERERHTSGTEGYLLSVRPDGILIAAPEPERKQRL
jgi:N-acetyl-beta-hexosaminidase